MNATLFLAGLAVGTGLGTLVFTGARRLAGISETQHRVRSPGEPEHDADR